jgi:hypothetical protein
MRIHHSIVEIGMAAIPASAPSRFSLTRKAGAAPRKTPRKDPNFVHQNLRKTQQKPTSSTLVNPKFFLTLPPAPCNGPRLCPARRRISRSASDSQAGLNIPDAVIPAKLRRLVCDTAAVLPSEHTLEKILRYETALERQLYRAMNEWECVQRRRHGENVPAPLALELPARP